MRWSLLRSGRRIAKHGSKSPRYKDKTRESGRNKSVRDAAMRDLYKAYRIDTSSAVAFQATMGHLSDDQRLDLMHKQTELNASVRTSAPKSDEMRDFEGRVAAQQASGRTQEAPAKDFTVDDEIEAREAKFEATVDEYNAGTAAAPAEPAPADAPSPDATGEQE